MVWIDIARIAVTGVILGAVIGKIVVDRPYHLGRLRPRSWLSIARKMSGKDWARLAAIVGIFTAMAFFVVTDVSRLVVMKWQLYSEQEYIFFKLAEVSLPVLAVAVTVLPIFEEWIFRGILLEEISRKSRSWLVGLVGSSLIFALFHLSNPGVFPASVIPMTVAGVILGSCYLLGGLGGAILSHSLYNAIVVLGLL